MQCKQSDSSFNVVSLTLIYFNPAVFTTRFSKLTNLFSNLISFYHWIISTVLLIYFSGPQKFRVLSVTNNRFNIKENSQYYNKKKLIKIGNITNKRVLFLQKQIFMLPYSYIVHNTHGSRCLRYRMFMVQVGYNTRCLWYRMVMVPNVYAARWLSYWFF